MKNTCRYEEKKLCGLRNFSVLKDTVPWRCYVTWWKWGLRWFGIEKSRVTLHVYKVTEGNILWIYFNVIKTNPACWLIKIFFLDKSEKMKWKLKSSSKTLLFKPCVHRKCWFILKTYLQAKRTRVSICTCKTPWLYENVNNSTQLKL